MLRSTKTHSDHFAIGVPNERARVAAKFEYVQPVVRNNRMFHGYFHHQLPADVPSCNPCFCQSIVPAHRSSSPAPHLEQARVAVQLCAAWKELHSVHLSKLLAGELDELLMLGQRPTQNQLLRLTLFFPSERPGSGLMRAQSRTVGYDVGFGVTLGDGSSLSPDAANTVPSVYLSLSRYSCMYSFSAVNPRTCLLWTVHLAMSGGITYSPSAIARLTLWYSAAFSLLEICLSRLEMPSLMSRWVGESIVRRLGAFLSFTRTP